MEEHRNESAGETRDPRENPPTSGIVRHDSRMQNLGVIQPRERRGLVVTLLTFHQGEPGSIPDCVTRKFTSRNRAGRCRWSAGFHGDILFPRPCFPALLRKHFASPTSALKTSMLRYVQILPVLTDAVGMDMFLVSEACRLERQRVTKYVNLMSGHLDAQGTELACNKLMQEPKRVKRGGAAPECKGGGDGRSTDKRHRPSRLPQAQIRGQLHRDSNQVLLVQHAQSLYSWWITHDSCDVGRTKHSFVLASCDYHRYDVIKLQHLQYSNETQDVRTQLASIAEKHRNSADVVESHVTCAEHRNIPWWSSRSSSSAGRNNGSGRRTGTRLDSQPVVLSWLSKYQTLRCPWFEVGYQKSSFTGSSFRIVRLLASQPGEPSSFPGEVPSGFSHVGIVPEYPDGLRPCFPALLHPHLASSPSAHRTLLTHLITNFLAADKRCAAGKTRAPRRRSMRREDKALDITRLRYAKSVIRRLIKQGASQCISDDRERDPRLCRPHDTAALAGKLATMDVVPVSLTGIRPPTRQGRGITSSYHKETRINATVGQILNLNLARRHILAPLPQRF
ncbi:hypothetical protein PR048_002174 [Dryococelus australis]|uniref:Uncharacterized protein n=1 Tax=Dryococelus australis TaxID=614101 RepID=A0ABQ9ILZ0_9NEOP|nr:hypothetical protein PR048_002174 [Dryococelus australis]